MDMEKHIDLINVEFETETDFDALYEQEIRDRKNAKKGKKKATAKADSKPLSTDGKLTPFPLRKCEQFKAYDPIFKSIRKFIADDELTSVKVSRGGKNAALFQKQEFYLVNQQLIYIHEKFEQYDENELIVEYIHVVNEDQTEMLQPMSVFKVLIGHMPKIEQIQFHNGKPAEHSPQFGNLD